MVHHWHQSALTRLKKLVVGFQSSRFRGDTAGQHLPLDTCFVHPALTMLDLKGSGENLEDLVSRIDAPLPESVNECSTRHCFATSSSAQKRSMHPSGVVITLFREGAVLNGETLKLGISRRTAGGRSFQAWRRSANPIHHASPARLGTPRHLSR